MSQKRDPLAIVGIGCRMPGGISTPDELWQMISAGRDGICEVPRDRWDWRRYYSEDPDAPGKIYVRNGGFLQQDIRQFDAEFFGISPREAMSLDPQQRLLLETSWEAIEDAGMSLARIGGSRTGVYIGALTLDNMLTQMSTLNCPNIGPHSAASSTMTMLSNRLSYFLDLHGPSLSVDTACSSSLVAFHLACQAIWNADCEMALVGAVNVMFRPEYMVAMCKGQFLAPDGRSKSFDQRANGYGRGEGAGVIVVKPLEEAVRDRDRIYAVVRATGCNQDGRTNGITVPNPEAQKSLILSVLHSSNVPAEKIHYVEAHGTGTPVGDPIEARAIGETLGVNRKNGGRLMMGSVKSNLGHLEAASGVTGLIKLCMCYKYGGIPPVANLGVPNSAIPFEQLGLRLPTTLEPLPQDREPVFFAINSFGYGGTNAHVILENPPVTVAPAREERGQPALLPVSARSQAALREMVARYRGVLVESVDGWREVCAAAGLRRTHHQFRVAFVARSCDEMTTQIDEWLSSAASTPERFERPNGRPAEPVFVFSGMGPQWWGMGQQLFECEPVFRDFVTRADAIYRAESGWSILEEMRRGKDTSRINQTIYAQPAIFVLQAGLVHLLRSWGVAPAALIGHSLGENATAYAAGVLSLEQALHVGYHRSQILARAAGVGGGMLAVGLSADEAQALIAPYRDRVTIAAINAPKNVTLAGDLDALAEISTLLQVKSVFNRPLKVEVAYHSAYMNPLQQPLIDALADLCPSLPKVQVYSTVTGTAVTDLAYDGPYWARNIRQTVQFLGALESAIADGHRLFLEVGAHPALTPSIREYIARNKVDAEVVATLVRESDEAKTLYKSLASLYAAGCNLNWASINGGPVGMIALPAYPWQRETYWDETEAAFAERVGGVPVMLPGRKVDMHEPVWERQINSQYLPYLNDHVVQKAVLLPGTAFVDAALSLQKETGRAGLPFAVEDLQFRQPLVVDRNDSVVLRTTLDGQSCRVVFYGRSERQQAAWTRHAEARLSAKLLTRPDPIDIDAVEATLGDPLDVAAFYSRLGCLGLEYGPNFRRIAVLRANDREVLAKLTAVEPARDYDIEHVLHPALLDSAFHSLLAAVGGDEHCYVPASIRQVAVFETIPDEVWCYGQLTQDGDDALVGNLSLLDKTGRVVAMVTGLRCAGIALAGSGRAALIERRLLHPTWQQTTLEPGERRTGAWLLLAEEGYPEGSFAAQVAALMSRKGCERVITIEVEIRNTRENGKNLIAQYPAESLAGIAYLACDRAVPASADVAIARAGQLLTLFKQLPANDSNLRVYMVTERAQGVEPGDLVDGFLQASAAGFIRVAHNEFPGLACSVVDHDGTWISAENLVAELLSDDEADEIAWRAGVRYTQRMEPCTLLELEKSNLARQAVTSVEGGRYRLMHTESGLAATGDPHRDTLYWKQDVSRELTEDEVEIAVGYWHVTSESGGPRPANARELTRARWREFSGRVSRVGAGVKRWRASDSIAAAALCQMASHVIVRERDLRAVRLSAAPSPESSSLAITGASINVALYQMARAKEGEGILVVGGAQNYAAQAFASTAKGLGLHVVNAIAGDLVLSAGPQAVQLDLRSDDFERRVLAANYGRPLDMVVFCETMNPALHSRIPLACGGRVVVYGAAESVDPARFIDSSAVYSLHRIHPTALAAAGATVYQAALPGLATGASHFGVPDSVCSAQELTTEADGARNRRIVDMSVMGDVVPAQAGEAIIDPAGAYVITGGFGGFGMAVADFLIAQGAGHVVLVGRSGAGTDGARERIAAWRERGVTIREALLDIASCDAVEALFNDLTAHHKVKGIFHAAGVVNDARIADMTADQLAGVMCPKVQGAWNLHLCSLRHQLPLDQFVLFSSAASIVGNGGQANYVAANAVLDALAAHRRARGLPGISINWGALADVGMATDDELRRQFQLMGIFPFSTGEAMSGLHAALRFQPVQIGIMDTDWVQWGKFEPTGGKSLRFAHLTGRRGGGLNSSLVDSLRQLAPQEQFDVAELMLAEQVAQTLRTSAERIDVRRPLSEMGIDSLMAVELQIAVNVAFGVEFSAFELIRGVSIHQLTTPLLERMGLSVVAGVTRPGRNQVPLPDEDLEKAAVLPPLPGNLAAQQLAV